MHTKQIRLLITIGEIGKLSGAVRQTNRTRFQFILNIREIRHIITNRNETYYWCRCPPGGWYPFLKPD